MHGPGRPVRPHVDLALAPLRLPTVTDTQDFGARLASVLRAGDLVVLTGPLGAGKTALVQGIGRGLGVGGRIASPTFVIARVHPGPLPLVHVDAYRIGSLTEVDDLDLDYDAADVVTVVEWGAGLVEQVNDERLEIVLERADDDVRTATLRPHGGDWAARLTGLLTG
ncbi:MAG: tRNA (adenosine(37)-N6)-threonylcarbamoyltransferase complex ATPase subunit type 1 TsaE [Jatrophihabitans sp.]|uniref:tRNA (adenosine(37)-N6)-threonylcarbamoyltransferase complex ATPase subunit type 1 TsaE n=1 Tax=Jatrophihabitans sp. TaxID=1932789 RepID=UPI003F7E31CE